MTVGEFMEYMMRAVKNSPHLVSSEISSITVTDHERKGNQFHVEGVRLTYYISRSSSSPTQGKIWVGEEPF